MSRLWLLGGMLIGSSLLGAGGCGRTNNGGLRLAQGGEPSNQGGDSSEAGAPSSAPAEPFCGDGQINGQEICDDGGTGTTALGACNPVCSGFYEKKFLRSTSAVFTASDLGGPLGADAKCQAEFGAAWKALLVGGERRATKTPYLADDAVDWVIHPYTHYYNVDRDQLVWRTDDVPLLGVRGGQRAYVFADAFESRGPGAYPWSGWAADWTTLADDPKRYQGTCDGWTKSSKADAWASFTFANLMPAAGVSCDTPSFVICVEQ